MWEEYAERFWAKVEKTGGCWWWRGARRSPRKGDSSYGVVRWGGERLSTHRVSYEMANGPIPIGQCVCHRCDNPLCVRPEHFFLGTYRENCEDRTAKGRQSKGEAHGHSKLTANDVRRMREMYARGDGTAKEIGALFGVKQPCAHTVIAGDGWKDVPRLTAEQLRVAKHANRSRVSKAACAKRWANHGTSAARP